MRTRTDDHRPEPTDRRVRRAAARLAAAAAISSSAVVLAAEVASARIAVNHSENAAVDR